MKAGKLGRIVWHDLFTADRQSSMAFYQCVAGWAYRIEHAADFAWGGGERDYVLALSGGEAGAGFAEAPPGLGNRWVAYVEVQDVDAAATLTEKLGGTIVRAPFDVPGVGRNALLRDPFGAFFGISLSRHSFPVPKRQFGLDVYLSEATATANAFYSRLFDWKVGSATARDEDGSVIAGPSGEGVAIILAAKPPTDAEAMWIPSLKVADPETALREAKVRGGKPVGEPLTVAANQHRSFLRDPNGALSCLRRNR